MESRDPSAFGSSSSGGALSHLVEAATALANLTSPSSSSVGGGGGGGGWENGPYYAFPEPEDEQQQQSSDAANKHVVTIISDEDEQHQQGGSQQEPTSSSLSSSPSRASLALPIASPTAASAAVAAANSKEIFPSRLMAILNDATLADIVTWLPHGRSFVIIRPDVFTERVLPQYLPPADARSSTKYPSFTRKLNRWYVWMV
jgi:HSF-type DNA-binding